MLQNGQLVKLFIFAVFANVELVPLGRSFLLGLPYISKPFVFCPLVGGYLAFVVCCGVT